MTTAQMRSRVTKKGQVTVPSRLRKQFHIEAGKSLEFEASGQSILIRPVRDIVDSGGALAKFADSDEMIREVLESRKKSFR
ncbi:MAG: AbrB/MazE/SpoVT family DNA-binding domain-containing protein [Nitrososphaerota archaeon]|nr:AbrB/MazE/SpoVT family DNA-binding domain-containing protein [Nitrososphaerota archaeon]